MRSASVLALVVTLALACAAPAGSSTSSDTSTEGSSTQVDESSDTSAATFTTDGPDLPESCDPFAQDCPDGEKCVPYASRGSSFDANKCVPVLGDQTAGEPCSYAGRAEATDDCDGSGVCWNVIELEGALVGTCHPYCTGTGDDPVCPEGYHCQLYGDGSKTICELVCDPVAQDCAPELGCFWSGTGFTCMTGFDAVPAGQPCGYINDCAPGHLCLSARIFPDCNAASCCASYCDVSLGDEQCDAVPGTTCSPFFEQPPAGQEHIGICGVP